jgi:hypothetical protein
LNWTALVIKFRTAVFACRLEADILSYRAPSAILIGQPEVQLDLIVLMIHLNTDR